ncbi:hypothetical protein EWM64_g2740 [Hericium alpestre]|uniref:Uncharacterized protein n=1 Tax=Hericium alpestre TaxID=135208 RepID=A0A4Z0A2K6_9AGAM|nr:hypothetical protein EWM64_g2740 [Hericium alpestre]
MRTGKTGLAVWDIASLPTHGPKGTNIVGRKMSERELNTSRSWEEEDIEFSSGALPTQRLQAAALSNIGLWKDHPSDPHSVLVKYAGRFSPSLVNMETQQLVTHYIGHGGFAMSLATSKEDPNCFVTGAKDGCVRLYDVRLPTPVLAIDHGEDVICSVLYEHVDGHPFVMLGGSRSEQIKVWDIRGPTPLYELSTGNNQCSYMAPSGYHYGYRPARFTFWEKDDSGDSTEKDDEEEGEEPDELGRCWPDRAPHTEAAFGYPLDSGEHRIYRYKFKHDADVKVLPPYGDASCNESDDLGGFGGIGDLGGLNLAALSGLGGGQDGECVVC